MKISILTNYLNILHIKYSHNTVYGHVRKKISLDKGLNVLGVILCLANKYVLNYCNIVHSCIVMMMILCCDSEHSFFKMVSSKTKCATVID